MRKFAFIFLLLLPPLVSGADLPPEIPALNHRTQVNTSNIMWPDRVFIRWQLSDGRWWCTWDTKEKVRAVIIQKIDNMLSPYGSGAATWRDIDLTLTVGANSLNTFERTWCFSWLPNP